MRAILSGSFQLRICSRGTVTVLDAYDVCRSARTSHSGRALHDAFDNGGLQRLIMDSRSSD